MNIRKYFSTLFFVSKVAVGLTILTAVLFFLLIEHVSSQFTGTAELPADCAVVFGAAVHKQTLSGPAIQRRVETAANVYKNGNVKQLFMTGGKGDELHDSEAEVMRRTAIEYGVPNEAITLEESATSTWENLAYTRPLVDKFGCESVIAISDAYHLARIRYLAKQQEWGNLRTLPAERRPERSFELRATVREAFGLVYYFINQYVSLEQYITPRSDAPVQ